MRCALLILLLLLIPTAATAQQKVVILDVPGGGTQEVVTAATNAGLAVEDQSWFVRQCRNRGIDPGGIMTRPQDLQWVMSGAEIRLVVHFVSANEQDSYRAVALDANANRAGSVEVERTPFGIDSDGARKVVKMVQGIVSQPVSSPEPVADDDAFLEVTTPSAASARRTQPPADSTTTEELGAWFFASASASVFKRDVLKYGLNGAQFSYRSKLYPGGLLTLELLPFMRTDSRAVGLFVDAEFGYDSVSVDDGESVQSLPVLHLGVFGGAAARYQVGRAHSRIHLGARWTHFSVDANPQLPTVGHLDLTLGGRIIWPIFHPQFFLAFHADVVPFGLFVANGEYYGESVFRHGFGAGLRAGFAFDERISLSGGWEGRATRSTFQGPGTRDFVDTRAFEQYQTFIVGIQLQY